MKALADHQRLWFYRALTLLVTAILVHLAAVWAAPRLIMQVLMNGPKATATFGKNQPHFPPPVTASARDIVLPSPDLLYSVCAFDVSQGPVRVTANPQLKSYWSVALYAANSDNFFVINDRKAGDKPVDLWLVSEGANRDGQKVPEGSTVVVSPSKQGFLLMRVLTGNYEAERATVEPARRTLNCTQI
ncbi:MAG: DUF1254 domain-containing protein [Rhodoferax sp.]|nr:DUF1254 domain-containing protein [Rhodoferax sp.]